MSKTLVQPYLSFNGRCEEALEFYRTAIGAETTMKMRFSESPQPHPPGMIPEGWDDKIMHASLKIGESVIMASDGGCHLEHKFQGFSLALSVPDEAAAQRAFAALSEGGQVTMPLAKTFWSPAFGMLSDKFGLGWMVSVEPSA